MTSSCCRQDQRVSFGYSLIRGKRASMEDFYHAQVLAVLPDDLQPSAPCWQCPSNSSAASISGLHSWLSMGFHTNLWFAAV